MRTVYIAGPYTSRGSDHKTEGENVRQAIAFGDAVAEMGLVPFIPHLNHFWNDQLPHEYEFWMAQTGTWLRKCDWVLRMPGASPGADEEVRIAEQLGKAIFYSLAMLHQAAIQFTADSIAER